MLIINGIKYNIDCIEHSIQDTTLIKKIIDGKEYLLKPTYKNPKMFYKDVEYICVELKDVLYKYDERILEKKSELINYPIYVNYISCGCEDCLHSICNLTTVFKKSKWNIIQHIYMHTDSISDLNGTYILLPKFIIKDLEVINNKLITDDRLPTYSEVINSNYN